MYHHSIALALAEARVADLQNAAAHSESTAPPRRRRRRLRAVVLGLAAIAALTPASALAQPTHDAATPAKAQAQAVHLHHGPTATRQSITFTNPLGRSRGPGAGAGLL
jgi:ferric-dicitrate binding protein FerR (iron transport regulator)